MLWIGRWLSDTASSAAYLPLEHGLTRWSTDQLVELFLIWWTKWLNLTTDELSTLTQRVHAEPVEGHVNSAICKPCIIVMSFVGWRDYSCARPMRVQAMTVCWRMRQLKTTSLVFCAQHLQRLSFILRFRSVVVSSRYTVWAINCGWESERCRNSSSVLLAYLPVRALLM